MITILKSKIHGARVTCAKLDYEGSITIDLELMKKAEIMPYEQVHVLDKTNGERIVTYAIKGNEGEICINGPAAKLIKKGHDVMVLSFVILPTKLAEKFKPKILVLDKKNKIVKMK